MVQPFFGLPADDPLRPFLQTPWESVFQLSADGLTYIMPASLRGVPVARIDESDDDGYWHPRWHSLQAYLDQEDEQKRLKFSWRERRRALANMPSSPEYKNAVAKEKLYSDNTSKQRKIREVFCPAPAGNQLWIKKPGSSTEGVWIAKPPYHPNQVVRKDLMPDGGICKDQELMYKLALKTYDLACLRRRGELSMDPWDFLRWRIGVKINELHPFWQRGGKHAPPVKSILNQIAEDSGVASGNTDPLLRDAVNRSITLVQGYANRVGAKKRKGSPGDDAGRPAARGNHRGRPRGRGRGAGSAGLSREEVAQRQQDEEEERRQRRKARLAMLKGDSAYRGTARGR